MGLFGGAVMKSGHFRVFLSGQKISSLRRRAFSARPDLLQLARWRSALRALLG